MSYLQNFKYEVFGSDSSPKLVFLHGLLGAGSNWRSVARIFEPDFQVLTYDQRGHGQSFQPESGYAPEDYAQDLKKILDELGWDRVHLVGHSMGGRAAMRFALMYPKSLMSLCIEDIGPDGAREDMIKTKKMIESVPVPFASRAQAKTYFEVDFPQQNDHLSDPKLMANFFFANLKSNDSDQWDWKFFMPGAVESIEKGHKNITMNDLQTLKMPTLFIRGESSTHLRQASYEQILQASPQIQGKVVAGSGHWVHHEQKEAFIQVLREFLLA